MKLLSLCVVLGAEDTNEQTAQTLPWGAHSFVEKKTKLIMQAVMVRQVLLKESSGGPEVSSLSYFQDHGEIPGGGDTRGV